MPNVLGRVRALLEDFGREGKSRAAFARSRRLHPSAFSRILRVASLPEELLSELEGLRQLSRTHLEVLAAAPPERRPAILLAIRSGESTYRLRERRESTGPLPDGPRAPCEPRAVGPEATP